MSLQSLVSASPYRSPATQNKCIKQVCSITYRACQSFGQTVLTSLFSSPHVLDIFNGFAICENSALCLYYTMDSSSLGRPLIWDTVAFLHDAGSVFVLQWSLLLQVKKWVVWGGTCLSFSDVSKTCRCLEVIWKILTAFFSCLPRPLFEKLKLSSKFKGDFVGGM